jgi:ATP adenylyltransferase
VATQRIWAPWRLEYVKDASKDIESECIFCVKPGEEDDEANLIVHRGERCFVILNKFPYTNGHLMVAPYDNVGFNQGRVAGAGVEHHIHMHVVPRWGGDTNFMPVLGDTRVMNQTLEDSYKTLRGAFD